MKKKSAIWYLLVLFFGAGLMLSSCKDTWNTSDGPNTPDEEALEKNSERGEALLSILSYTAGLDSLPDDWYKNSYTVEPTVGRTKDDASPYVRYVAVSDAEEADAEYRSMISAGVTGTVDKNSWSMDGIGSLDFKVCDESDVIATVDVNVQQLPHLTQIRFVPPSVLGDNSSWFDGTPYYNFGDVVKVTNERAGTEEYWICIRPADKDASKSTTHWVSFSILDNNFKTYTKTDKATLILPDKLGDKSNSESRFPYLLQFINAIRPGLYDYTDRDRVFADVKIGGVTRTASQLRKIAKIWNYNKFFHNANIIPRSVIPVLMSPFKDGKDLNILYYGHHCGKDVADVHVLKIDHTNFKVTNTNEVKFTWPADNDKYSFKDYAGSGDKSFKLNNLQYKSQTKTLPEKAIMLKYKNGPTLSCTSTFWGNDKKPGQSFRDYANNDTLKFEDVIVSNSYTSVDKYFKLGCVVLDKQDNQGDRSSRLLCVKSANESYNGLQRNAIFLDPNEDHASIAGDVTTGDFKVAMFHLLNTYIMHEKSTEIVSDFYKENLSALYSYFTMIFGKRLVFPDRDNQDNKEFEVKIIFHIGTNYYTCSLSYNTDTKNYTYHSAESTEDDLKNYRVFVLRALNDDGKEQPNFPIELVSDAATYTQQAKDASDLYNEKMSDY